MVRRSRCWVFAALAVAACGGSPTTPTNPTTLSAHLSVTIDGLGSAVAVTSVSQVRFDALQSTGPGPLQFLVDYGDQTTSDKPVSDHTYTAPGTYVAVVTVTDTSGHTAQTSSTVTVRSVEGSWFAASLNQITNALEVRHLVIATQTERTVTGEFVGPGTTASVPVHGTLGDDRSLTLTAAGQSEVKGTIPSEVFAEDATLQLRGFPGSADGTLAFHPVVGQPTGPPPTVTLALYFDDDGSTGAVLGFTPIRFTAAAPSADGPLYFIDFGDGQATAGAEAVHACQRSWELTARATVVDRFGRAGSTSSTFICHSLVPGLGFFWESSIWNPRARRWEDRYLDVTSQGGTSLRGSYRHPEGGSTPFTGKLSGQNDITITLDDGTITFVGHVIAPWHLILTARGGSADGMTLDFQYTDSY